MKLRSLIILTGLVGVSYGQGQELESGTHYRLIAPAQPTSSAADVVEVAEFFQYSCPACLALEPHLAEWLSSSKPDYVNFVRVPVVWNPLARLHAQAYYTAEVLGKIEAVHAPFFDEYHEKGNELDTEEKLAEFFARFEVSRQEFENAFESFAVHTKVRRADELTRRYLVSLTPTLVVDGRYNTVGSMATSYANWFDNINKLAAAEHEK